METTALPTDRRTSGGATQSRDAAARAERTLQWATFALAVATGVVVGFVSRWWELEETHWLGGNTWESSFHLFTLNEAHGWAVALLPLLPAVIVLLPLMLPAHRRTAAWTVAAVITVASLITVGSAGGYYLPLALLLWLAVLVPAWIRRGRPRSWGRIGVAVGALGVVLGALGTLGSLQPRQVPGGEPVLWATLAAMVVLAVLFALRVRYIPEVLVMLGAGAMLAAGFGGSPALMSWCAGGVWLAVGLSATAARPAPTRQPE